MHTPAPTPEDLAIAQARADAARQQPYWPFDKLDPIQLRHVQLQRLTLRARAEAPRPGRLP